MIDLNVIYTDIESTLLRMEKWIRFHYEEDLNSSKEDIGVFVKFDRHNSKCLNTGIYNKIIGMSNYRYRFNFEGFNWDKNSLRKELLKRIKEYRIKEQLENMNVDFK